MELFGSRKKRKKQIVRRRPIQPVSGGYAAAILLAAGQGSRVGGENKLVRPILGKSALRRSLETLLSCESLKNIAVVVSAHTRKHALQLIESLQVSERCILVDGGPSRGESAYAGLKCLHQLHPAPSIVAIHDAARCLMSLETLEACLQSARAHGSGIAGIPASDTIRRVSEHGLVLGEINRDELWQVQTPQAFAFDTILRCYERAIEAKHKASDDATLLLRSGYEAHMVRARADNIKITNPEDFILVESLIRRQTAPKTPIASRPQLRLGLGEDTHRLVVGRKLILGGVEIPFERGLLGHSDADVLTHAIMDALLGAAALGDIGRHFPDSDPRFKDANSIELLRQVAGMLRRHALNTINIDATITAEAPKLAPFIEAICTNIASALDISPSCVSVKATTNEGLGFAGRGEGLSAKAVALIENAIF